MNYRKNKLFGLGIAILVLGLVVVGCGEAEETEEQPEAEEATPVEVVEAERGEVVNHATVVGQAEPYKTVRVTPQVQGEIKSIEVEKGDQVQTGEKLLQIDREELENQVRQSRANLRVAQANLDQALAGTREEELAQLESQLEQARSNYEQAKRNYERQQELYEKGVISEQQLESSENQYISARSGYRSAEENLKLAERGPRDEELETLRAQVEQAESGLESAKLRLEKAQVEAPSSGLVSSVEAEAGEMAGSQPVVTLVTLDPIRVTAQISERYVPVLETGDQVEISFKALEQEFTGEINKLDSVADRERGNYPLEVILANEAHRIKAGMYGEVKFKIAEAVDKIIIPREAVLIREDRHYVYTIEAGEAVYKEVETGLSDGEKIVIKAGLEAGEQVITTGNEQVADGEAVRTVGQGEI